MCMLSNVFPCFQSVGLDALFRAKNALNCVAGCPDGSYKLRMDLAVDRIVFGALCDAADAMQSNGQVTFREEPHLIYFES